jgi:hypothetical protein
MSLMFDPYPNLSAQISGISDQAVNFLSHTASSNHHRDVGAEMNYSCLRKFPLGLLMLLELITQERRRAL